MKTEEIQSENQNQSILFNRVAYVVMFCVGILYLFLKDWSQAVIFTGLALVFEPFDSRIPFHQRKMLQKIWLIAHVIIVFVLFGTLIFSK